MNIAPTVGSIVGSATGLVIASKLGLNPLDAGSGGAVIAAIAGLFAALFHWIGGKTGIAGLG
jgi:predicted regulator of Ras-like GTPase activity (Roadblock/LC7/MglB family)